MEQLWSWLQIATVCLLVLAAAYFLLRNAAAHWQANAGSSKVGCGPCQQCQAQVKSRV